jgi:uridylate kinase
VTHTGETPGQPVLVRKYGGSSLATVARIQTVARDIRRARDEGYQVVVVVSAMGGTTDELEALANEANPAPPRRELDMLLSVGERITMSLLSMALAAEGCPAISYTGSQCGIITDTSHTDARILEVKGDRVRESLAEGFTVVVAGFQGVSRDREITTLGRGGSDTTAVALAATLGAVRCEILKDVDGVMTADPREVPDARRHDQLDYDAMRQVAASGSGVVHIRAVEYAAQHEVPLVVRSSFHDGPGTAVGHGERPALPAPCDAPCQRTNRYRPLVMNIDHGVGRLRVVTDDPVLALKCRDTVLAVLDPADTITEWLDGGAGFRWEVLGAAAPLASLKAQLETVATGEMDLVWQEDLHCISLAGGRPDSWLEVERHVAGLLEELEVGSWRLRADGSALRVLVPGDLPADLAARLHEALLPA